MRALSGVGVVWVLLLTTGGHAQEGAVFRGSPSPKILNDRPQRLIRLSIFRS